MQAAQKVAMEINGTAAFRHNLELFNQLQETCDSLNRQVQKQHKYHKALTLIALAPVGDSENMRKVAKEALKL
jgi:hypothetical protein